MGQVLHLKLTKIQLVLQNMKVHHHVHKHVQLNPKVHKLKLSSHPISVTFAVTTSSHPHLVLPSCLLP